MKIRKNKLGQSWHTDPEQRIGFYECVKGCEVILVISNCVQNIYKKNWNDSMSTFLEIHKYIFTKWYQIKQNFSIANQQFQKHALPY